ncbi:AraC family transcriptional regulator [Chitinophaga sp. 22321]|uniref:Helix-turn-helix domain-containing protein n=1 Tax=Chitinophaga hostae TaxID=2831022 RepID=A0ABS5J8M6_9BACT|nr:AraC family transcriptional regulator [Chitinophaga hostae]MBS0031564.1 helix-turn-helix domain-containing protein [Chitinophaga hostae]
MEVINLFKPFDIMYVEEENCPMGKHRNNFFELLYILKGTGELHNNQHVVEYGPENLFLFMPQDTHYTRIKEKTAFIFVRFNGIYLEAQRAGNPHSNLGDWAKKLEYIFHNNQHFPGCILRNMDDKPIVRALVNALILEYPKEQSMRNEVVQQLVNTIITIVARNVAQVQPEKSVVNSEISNEIISYIHQNIYYPEKLRAEKLAARFNISQNYISEYVKKVTGESIQRYVTNYKLKLVETRLQYSDMRMSEIVEELGFTDESHLNRTFKKYTGINPTDFRKKMWAEKNYQPGMSG